MDHQGNETQYYSFRNGKKAKKRECCLCGDVGFQERLFRCHRCYHRFQHIYCSRLYSDQLDLDRVNVCDWCLDFHAKEKIQSHKRKVELKEMGSKKAKKVADSEIVSRPASTSTMKQPASVTMKKSRKVNAKAGSHRLHVKFGGIKKNQFGRSKNNKPSSLLQDCKITTELRTSTQKSPTNGGFRRRYKLLSDVLCSQR